MRSATPPTISALARGAALGFLFATLAQWQIVSAQQAAAPQTPADSQAERAELAAALREAQGSPLDTIRVLENYLRQHPNPSVLPEIQQLLAKEAMEANDTRRIVLYGLPTLERTPSDPQLLDRVTSALLLTGDKANAEKALEFAKRFEAYVIRIPVPTGSDPMRNQEDHDRALQRALRYQSRALAIMGNFDESRRKAALAYIAYPDESSAREFAQALERVGDHEGAIQRMAEAFAIPDLRAKLSERSQDRQELGEMYKKLHHGSEVGLGDEILKAYDRTMAVMEKRRRELLALDPNGAATEPAQFVLDGLDGRKLALAGLKGKVVILDFWATWCVPCRAQHPLYEQLKQKFNDRTDVVFVAVDCDEDREVVGPFLEAQNWSRDVYFESGLARNLMVVDIPTTVILDRDGRVASRMNGFFPDRFVEQISSRIQSILSGPVETGTASKASVR